MSVLPPDYDSGPARWQSWTSPRDVHNLVAPGLRGPVLDVGCGEGRLASLLGDDVSWVGVDSSPAQLAASPYRPVVRADMRALPFRDGVFAEVTHLWCLYHLAEPAVAITEAARVLEPGGRSFACTAARDSDPEILPEGYPPSPFDAEESAEIVATVFDDDLITGIAVSLLALGFASAFGRTHGVAWTTPLLGVWVIISPWVVSGVSATTSIVVSSVISGAAICLLGLSASGFTMMRDFTVTRKHTVSYDGASQ
ncbi:MAG: methyltransferase domain-containing protein [Nocardioidaceae bacterium]